MKTDSLWSEYDPMLFGVNADSGLVGIEHREGEDGDEVVLFFRREGKVVQECEPFRPFIVAALEIIGDCPVEYQATTLQGKGKLNLHASFASWKDFLKAKSWLGKETGMSASAPGAPYVCVNDPIQQYLMASGRTHFMGMGFEDLSRLQVDIECLTSEGYDFCNAEREGDRIVAIAMGDQTGWTEVLSGIDMDEKTLLKRFVARVKERDPDVIEGHNIFNFDLPYIKARAKRHKVKLALGRDGSLPRMRSSRMNVGERTIAYERCNIYGRHVVDTLFLVHAYDIAHRSLSGYGLKDVARHFGIAPKGRTYIDGARIAETYARDPEKVMRYVTDDILETRGLSDLLSMSGFVQAQMLPYSYQNTCVRGNATKIDALLVREYLRQGRALPMPGRSRGFAGGYTDMFAEGVIENVHHCDIRSLYPSLMLTQAIAPQQDDQGVFLKLLDLLRTFRLEAKGKQERAKSQREKAYFEALQSTFKVLINSFYGYLGFAPGRFSDFDAAEQVTAGGRALLKKMIKWLEKHGARPIEIDTDGIYFVPPAKSIDDSAQPAAYSEKAASQEFRRGLQEALPEGIDVEFDGEYVSMYSYKMKNYALLTADGEMVIKGAALKSRGLEPFQRQFLKAVLRFRLEGKEQEISALKSEYEKSIREQEWDVDMLAKTERLQDSPSTYETKRSKGKSSKRAVYELALASEREYRAGDQVSYYVTGKVKSVAVHEFAKLASEWDAGNRDENVPYYAAKLEALYKKFGGINPQGELGL